MAYDTHHEETSLFEHWLKRCNRPLYKRLRHRYLKIVNLRETVLPSNVKGNSRNGPDHPSPASRGPHP